MKYYLFLIFIFLISSCAQNSAYRNNDKICYYDKGKFCNDSYLTASHNKSYSLSFVEIDDQGHFQSRSQLNDVLKYVKEKGDNQDIVLFIHGWHHNASYSDDSKSSNVTDFRKLLESLSRRNGTRKITGIYVGWRGESVEIPGVNALTFWERKNVSIEVGNGAFIELVYRLAEIRKETSKSKFIAIGHSFGGSVLFSAMKNEIYKDILVSNGDIGELDTYILVNPAIESTPFSPLRDIIEEISYANKSSYSIMASPKLAVFMSESDWATKYTFPAGRIISSSFENQNTLKRVDRNGDIREYSQYWMDMQALGHYKPFVTHELKQILPLPLDNGCEPSIQKWSDKIKSRDEGWVVDFESSAVSLRHLSNSPAFSPVWVVDVDNKIIPNHNGIFGNQFSCFVEEILLMK